MDLSEGKKSAIHHHVKKGHTSKHHHYQEKRDDGQSGNKLATRYAVNRPAVRPHGLILSQDGATAHTHLLDAFPCRLDRFSIGFRTEKFDV